MIIKFYNCLEICLGSNKSKWDIYDNLSYTTPNQVVFAIKLTGIQMLQATMENRNHKMSIEICN